MRKPTPSSLAERTGGMRDPVCGMAVEPSSAAAKRIHGEKDYYFCSNGCAQQFDRAPERYLGVLERVDFHRKPIPSATTGVEQDLPGPRQVEIPLLNLDHPASVQTIIQSLQGLDGVKHTDVNFATSKARITYDPAHISHGDMRQAIRNTCPVT